MTTRPSGWYDDPDDDELLRYFDGIVWTEHTALKRPRQPEPAPAPEEARPGATGAAGADSAQRWRGGPQDAPGRGAPGFGGAGGPGYGGGYNGGYGGGYGGPGYAPPGGFGPDAQRRMRRDWTDDGVPRAGWWRRVAAFVVDYLLMCLVTTPFVLGRIGEIQTGFDRLWSQALAAPGTTVQPDADLVAAILVVSMTNALLTFLYEVVFLCWKGATVGHLLFGMRVRPATTAAVAAGAEAGTSPGVSVRVALQRSIVKYASNLLGGVPILSVAAGIFQIVDYLWPLWDERRLAVHDRVARTEVVLRRRGAPERNDAAGAERGGAHRR